MRVFAISDLHVDYAVNAQWLESLSQVDYLSDTLIVAGDISDSTSLLERCVVSLVRRFKRVLFVPGNHELWVVRGKRKIDSLEKFREVRAAVERSGAHIEPYHHGNLSIVPLLGWYDYSFGIPKAELRGAWMDFQACLWPSTWSLADVTSHFLQMNSYRRRDEREVIVSFSHFLPRIDVVSQVVSDRYRYLFPVMGAAKLGHQVRQLQSNVHVYGHSHLNRNVQLNGTLYINNAFGYPHEGHIAAKKLRCVYDCS